MERGVNKTARRGRGGGTLLDMAFRAGDDIYLGIGIGNGTGMGTGLICLREAGYLQELPR